MKKVVSVNLGNFGSTGRIMMGIANAARRQGYITYNAYPGSYNVQPKVENDIVICSILANRINQKLAYYTGLNGCFAVFSTIRFLHVLDRIKPDILHFHNLHNSYINLPMLFHYVKKHHIRVIWTFHDCWPFTGHCPYFTLAGCDKWKTGCGGCPQLTVYPPSRTDTTRWLWEKKKMWFTGVKDLTIVTPSQWLASLVKQSFLAEYPVRVINNGIDLEVFNPTESDFREKYGINQERLLILGIAFDWGKRKGLDVFFYLSEHLDHRYQIVLVGTDANIDKELPKNIISIHRTHDQRELAAIYSAADVFVNPTREDNFPTVNIESLACGTPVITFATGGSPEIIDDNSGRIIKCDDKEGLLQEVVRVCMDRERFKQSCISRAMLYEQNERFDDYVKLYNQ